MLTYFKSIHSSISKSLPREAKRSGGFTLMELLMVVVISTILMTTVVIQQRKWDDHLSINSQTYELALMIRQAQVFALGVKENPKAVVSGEDRFDLGYGVRVSILTPDQYVFFVDRNKYFKYNSGNENIPDQSKIFVKGVVIDRVCGLLNGGAEFCNNSPGATLKTIDITFLRPNVGAKGKFLNGLGNEISGIFFYTLPATIYLRSPNNKISSIEVAANGKVSITNAQ